MSLSVTNDGVTYRYSRTRFTYFGNCLPTTFTTYMFGALCALGLLFLSFCVCVCIWRSQVLRNVRDDLVNRSRDFSPLHDEEDEEAGTMAVGAIGKAESNDDGVLLVTVVEAANLEERGAAYAADPFVTLDAGGKKQVKTKVMSKTLSPSWNEQLRIQGKLHEFVDASGPGKGMLKLEVIRKYAHTRLRS
eukprot:4055500-Pleurochrysis_carterae.AAC.8